MLPQIGISVKRSVLNTSTHANDNQQEQGHKQQPIQLGTTDGGAYDLQGIEEEGHLAEQGHKGVLGLEESGIGRCCASPSAEDEGKGKECRHPAEERLDGARVVASLCAATPEKDTTGDESSGHQDQKDCGNIYHSPF